MDEDRIYGLLFWEGLRHWLPNGWFIHCRARVADISPGRPFGLKYSLTLHDAEGLRLMGFDNAHGISRVVAYDHQHRFRRAQEAVPYDFRDSYLLLADFMETVRKICWQEGIGFRFIEREYVAAEVFDEDEDDER